jgi:hypothetical protein
VKTDILLDHMAFCLLVFSVCHTAVWANALVWRACCCIVHNINPITTKLKPAAIATVAKDLGLDDKG